MGPGRHTEPAVTTASSARVADVRHDLVDRRRGNTTCPAVLALIASAGVVNAGGRRRAFLATGARPGDRPPEWVAARTRLVGLLGADSTVAKTVTTALGILAPPATGVLAVALPAVR